MTKAERIEYWKRWKAFARSNPKKYRVGLLNRDGIIFTFLEERVSHTISGVQTRETLGTGTQKILTTGWIVVEYMEWNQNIPR